MKTFLLLTASALTFAGAMSAADAGMVKQGTPSQGVYWGLEKDSIGRISYECYDENTDQKVSEQKCTDAKAKKPMRVTRRTDLM
jgi:hypothetical protein